jgi:hypothetical protein
VSSDRRLTTDHYRVRPIGDRRHCPRAGIVPGLIAARPERQEYGERCEHRERWNIRRTNLSRSVPAGYRLRTASSAIRRTIRSTASTAYTTETDGPAAAAAATRPSSPTPSSEVTVPHRRSPTSRGDSLHDPAPGSRARPTNCALPYRPQPLYASFF